VPSAHNTRRAQNNGYVVVMSSMTRVKGGSRRGGPADTFGLDRLAPKSPGHALRSPAHPSMAGGVGVLQSPLHAPCAPHLLLQ
jgi:hypothetical protein